MLTRQDIYDIRDRQNRQGLEAPSTRAFAAQKAIDPLCETALALYDELERLKPHHMPGLIRQLEEAKP